MFDETVTVIGVCCDSTLHPVPLPGPFHVEETPVILPSESIVALDVSEEIQVRSTVAFEGE